MKKKTKNDVLKDIVKGHNEDIIDEIIERIAYIARETSDDCDDEDDCNTDTTSIFNYIFKRRK